MVARRHSRSYRRRMHRPIVAASTTLLAALALAGCTSQTQKCSGGVCEIDLSGAGANVQLGGDGGSEIELIRASGKTATVKLGTNEAELTVGMPMQLDNATLELTEVEGEDDVQLKLTGTPDGGSAGNAEN